MNKNISQNTYAVVDIGSVKVKTLIASVSPTGILEQKYFSNVLTCFGCEMDLNDGYVRPQYIERTIDELRRVKKIIDDYGVTKFKVVSTHAMRRAKNKDEIKKRIQKELGVEVEDISHQKEAELFFEAVMKTFNTDKDYAIVDMGGGSAQILIGNSKGLKKIHMMQTGSEYLHTNFTTYCENPKSKTTADNHRRMKEYILNQLSPLQTGGKFPLIYGSSNIIDLFKFLSIPLEQYSASAAHPYKTSAQYLKDFIERILPLSYEEREKLYPFQKGYMYGVDKAFLNITTIANYLQSPYIVPSNANIAQGIIYSMQTNEN